VTESATLRSLRLPAGRGRAARRRGPERERYGPSRTASSGSTARRTSRCTAWPHSATCTSTGRRPNSLRKSASLRPSTPAQYNDDAMFQDPVTVEDVVESRVVADPLHLLDCCVISDGGGALVLVSEDVRDDLDREAVEVLGHGEAPSHHDAGRIDITRTGAESSGERAFAEAGLGPAGHRLRVDLRLLHHHRSRGDRGSVGSARRARAASSSKAARYRHRTETFRSTPTVAASARITLRTVAG